MTWHLFLTWLSLWHSYVSLATGNYQNTPYLLFLPATTRPHASAPPASMSAAAAALCPRGPPPAYPSMEPRPPRPPFLPRTQADARCAAAGATRRWRSQEGGERWCAQEGGERRRRRRSGTDWARGRGGAHAGFSSAPFLLLAHGSSPAPGRARPQSPWRRRGRTRSRPLARSAGGARQRRERSSAAAPGGRCGRRLLPLLFTPSPAPLPPGPPPRLLRAAARRRPVR